MFGWAHHLYILPNLAWIRYVAYIISMTEWLLFIHIIYDWHKKNKPKTKEPFTMEYKFILATNFWVFVNLLFALLLSIPSLNYFLHGTHVIVAHSMGTTIGINTSILFASVFYIRTRLGSNEESLKFLSKGFYFFHSVLLLFLVSLIGAGIHKALWMYTDLETKSSFGAMQESSNPFFVAFVSFGVLLFVAILWLTIPLIKSFIKSVLKK
jgi:nitric oxide reductase subunit B